MPDDIGGPAGGERLPVFISSTFEDMDRERDLLVHAVIPVVNARLREAGHRVALYPVDLRWGISLEPGESAQQRDRKILATCVDEVARCRPFFIGLIGERVGWVPSPALQRALLDRGELSDPGFEISVTALEILAAMGAAARDGHPPILVRRRTNSETGVRPAQTEGVRRLVEFATARGVPIREYGPVAPRPGDTSADDFVAVLTELIMTLASSVVRPLAKRTWLDDELQAQTLARKALSDSFVGRADEIERIRSNWVRDLASNDRFGDDLGTEIGQLRPRWDNHAIAVLGDSGIGKSALLAFIAEKVTIAHEFEDHLRAILGTGGIPSVHVSVGVTPASCRLPVVLVLLLAQLDPDAARRIASGRDPSDLVLADVRDLWTRALSPLSVADSRVVIVDGLDRLAGPAAEWVGLDWVPTDLRDRYKLLVSATPDSIPGLLLGSRVGTEILMLESLPRHDAVDLIARRASSMHRSIPPEMVARLTSRPRTPRWLVVATDLLFTLIVHDYVAVRGLPAGTDPAQAISALLIDVADDLPDDVDDLHEEVYLRLMDVIGPAPATVLALMQMTESGLRDADLVAVLGDLGADNRQLDLALVRNVLGAHVATVGEHWSFAHPTARAAAAGLVSMLREEDPATVDALTVAVVRHLLSLDPTDTVRVRELLPLLLSVSEASELLVNLLGDADRTPYASLPHLAAAIGRRLVLDVPTIDARLLPESGSPTGRLTMIALVSAVLPAVGPERRTDLSHSLLASMVAIPDTVRSRTGETGSELRVRIEALTTNWLAAQTVEAIADQARSVRAQGLPLAQVLSGCRRNYCSFPALDQIVVEVQVVFDYAIQCIAEPQPHADDDARAAAEAIGAWRSLIRNRPGPDPDTPGQIGVMIAAINRAADLAWPGAGFRPDPADVRAAVGLAERRFGVTIAVLAYAMVVRARLAELVTDGSDEPGEPLGLDPQRFENALRMAEDCLWRIDVQRTAIGDDLVLVSGAVQLRAMLFALFADAEQMASAAAVGLKLCHEEHAVALLSWPGFLEVALGTIGALQASLGRDGAFVVVAKVLDGIATWGIPDGIDFPDLVPELLAFGFDNAVRSGELALVPRLIEMTEALRSDGWLSGSAACTLIREFAYSMIEEFTDDDMTEMLQDGEVDLADGPTVMPVVDTLGRVGTVLADDYNDPSAVVIGVVVEVLRWLYSGDVDAADRARRGIGAAGRYARTEADAAALGWAMEALVWVRQG